MDGLKYMIDKDNVRIGAAKLPRKLNREHRIELLDIGVRYDDVTISLRLLSGHIQTARLVIKKRDVNNTVVPICVTSQVDVERALAIVILALKKGYIRKTERGGERYVLSIWIILGDNDDKAVHLPLTSAKISANTSLTTIFAVLL